LSIEDEAADRRAFAYPELAADVEDGVDPDDSDLHDEATREFLIRDEHQLESIEDFDFDHEAVPMHGGNVNPTVHLAMHQIVANQIWDDNPPETWRTARRLLQIGYDRHEVLHMLAWVASEELWDLLSEKQPHNAARYAARLATLPDSYEAHRRRIDRPRRVGGGHAQQTKCFGRRAVMHVQVVSGKSLPRRVGPPRRGGTRAQPGEEIQLGAFGALAPERRGEVARFGLLALLAGSLANLANAAIVGIVAS
jgi:hypothetical protein